MSATIIPMDKARSGQRLLAAAAPVQVGQRLAAALRVAGLSQADLVRLIGGNSSQVTYWIKGRNRPSLDFLLRALPYLDVDLNYLFLGDFGTMPYARRDALQNALEDIRREADGDDSEGGAHKVG